MPRKRRAAGIDGGAGFPCVAYDHATGEQIAGQDCNDASQPGGIPKISGYVDDLFANPNGSGDQPVWDGTFPFFKISDNLYSGSYTTFTLQLNGGIVCRVTIQDLGGSFQMLIGNDFPGGGCLWSGVHTGSAINGIYINDGLSLDPLPASVTVVFILGTLTPTTIGGCAS